MRILTALLGLALLLTGIYFLGRNIIFTTQVSPYWWRDVSAAGSVIALASGVMSLMLFRGSARSLGWILIGLGILLVFVSGGVILKPTSLWTLFLALVSLVAGFQLITTGRMRF